MTEYVYVNRYVDGTDLKDRKHSRTLGVFNTAEEAEAARQATDRPDLLEVQVRSK